MAPAKRPPYLAGQYAQYIAFELQMWRRGYRKNSEEIMLIFANKLDDQDIAAVAAYYQQLPTQRIRDKQRGDHGLHH